MSAKLKAARLIAAVFMAIAAWFCQAGDGLENVLSRLRTPSNLHFVPERRTLCFTGASIAKCDVAGAPERVMTARAVAFDKAVMEARKGLARFLSQHLAVWESVLDASRDDSSLWLTSSNSKGWSSVVLDGCVVVDYAELMEGGDLYVAVTIEWSPDCAIAAKLARTNRIYLDTEDFAQVVTWAKSVRLAKKLGPRMCSITHDGGSWLVPAGTAAVDIEGLSGLRLKAAMRKVEADASRAFEQAVETPLEVVFEDASSVSRQSSGHDDAIKVHEKFASSTIAASHGMNLVRRRIVHEGVVRDETTGRRLYAMTYAPDCFARPVVHAADVDDL